MRKLVSVSSLSLALWAGFGTSVEGGAPEPPEIHLDPATGDIGGKVAVVVYPARYENGKVGEFLSPDDFEAHLTPQDDPDVELVFPCGSWFQPPRGRYRVWIEGPWLMSPYSSLLLYAGGTFRGRGLAAALPFAGAGRVVLPDDLDSGPDLELRLLHAGSHLEGHLVRWELSRRKAADQVGDGLLMPVGPAVGALWDRRSQRYRALSPLFQVRARETVVVPLERPQTGAQLVVLLRRDRKASTIEDQDVEVTLVREESGALTPDVKVQTATTVYAIWYALPAETVEVKAESRRSYLEPQPIDLLPGRIERLTGDLRPRPELDIELVLPPVLEDEALVLELRQLPSGEVVAQHTLPRGVWAHRFERLPATLLEVDLQTDLGAFKRKIDLSSGESAFVLLEPQPIVVSGTVYHGDDGRPAELTFTTVTKRSAEAKADERGAYEVVVLEPLRSVSIELDRSDVESDGLKSTPYVDFFPDAVAETRELDFRLPDNHFDVRVADAVTGRGIAGAAVVFRNVVSAVEERDEADRRSRDMGRTKAILQQALTDGSGIARLPPVRVGRLEIRASADGYARMREPAAAVVAEGTTARSFEVLLDPIGEAVELRLRLPNGESAASAEVLLMDSLVAGRAIFSAIADAEGLVETPRGVDGFLLVRHSRAAFLVQRWQPREGESEIEWSLPAASGLSIHVKDKWGREVAPNAELALWVNGWRLSGSALAWLTGTRARADPNGFWTVSNLPRAPVSVLAWGLGVRDQAYAGDLDSLGVEVPFPWPKLVEVRAVH